MESPKRNNVRVNPDGIQAAVTWRLVLGIITALAVVLTLYFNSENTRLKAELLSKDTALNASHTRERYNQDMINYLGTSVYTNNDRLNRMESWRDSITKYLYLAGVIPFPSPFANILNDLSADKGARQKRVNLK